MRSGRKIKRRPDAAADNWELSLVNMPELKDQRRATVLFVFGLKDRRSLKRSVLEGRFLAARILFECRI
jgi:hypothetical protein